MTEAVAWMYHFGANHPVILPSKRDWADNNPNWTETPLYPAQALRARDERIAELERENAQLRSDLLENCVADHGCEKCGSPLFDGDHTFTDPDGNSGCWYAFLAPEKAGEVPCYRYRIALKEKNDG